MAAIRQKDIKDIDVVVRLGEPDLAPEDRAKTIREVRDRLVHAEEMSRQARGERDMMVEEIQALRTRSAALQAERASLQAERAGLHRAVVEAQQVAQSLRVEMTRLTEMHAQVRAELVVTRGREAALAEQVKLKARQALPDAEEYAGLRPDPLGAGTSAELIGSLRRFRIWAGNPSFRDMAARSGRRAAASSMCTVLGSSDLPDRLEVIDAIIEGCGGSEQDRRKFATAWRNLTLAEGARMPFPAPGSHLRAV